ncbi:nuclear transport factor 2-like protein [Noviherbaspirillum pedocola]|uniref:Nuclear transport factor 2 family protein n=1 Tax=Noviherbaspirillum pedocola TaxID=2801341 RepID=A0A934W771_9BURK|nr:nuclear transport factor 2 family protein [Noviherbaspirillum pedocola]MBK4735208.1 nuclear transport factor 2 family protein [Noviherbaspirillum pedocola]
MYAFDLSLQYRIAVRDRDFDKVLAIFTPDAEIITPLKGTCDVKSYHLWLFKTVKKSTVKVKNVFQALNGDISIAVQSDYEWLMHDDQLIHFGGMSVFEFTPDKRHIRKMTTFYDTSLVRPQMIKTGLLAQ